jgi:DMSO/TMAO reductase YedYZ molybdopterin-dependent catalytic subunit
MVRRRHFLLGAAGAAGTAVTVGAGGLPLPVAAQEEGPLPDYASWKNAEALIVHSENTMETKRGFIGTGSATPSDILFVRNNVAPPDASIVAEPNAWEVAFEGVANPATMTVGELKRLGVTTVATVLQCSGNGRGLFDHEASGSPWITGAAGCVLWTGVPLMAAVEAMGGAAANARFITSTGGEVIPEGIEP